MPASPKQERPRDEFGRPLPWGSESRIALLDFDSLPLAQNHELAIEYFNQEQFFSAHEAWEAAWRQARGGGDEQFYNGLAKLGAGLTHIQRGNSYGARTLIGKAIERIEPYGPYHQNLDLMSLCSDLRALLASLADRGPAPGVAFPRVRRSP